MLSAFKIRAIYLFMYMAFAVWRIYYNIFLENLGFKGTQIGTLNAIMMATIFFVVLFWGMIADKRGIRPTLRLLAIISAVLIFSLGMIQSYGLLLLFIPFLTLFYHPLGPLTDALATQYAQTDNKHSFGSFRLWGSLGWGIAAVASGFVFSEISIDYIFTISAILFLVPIVFLSTRNKRKTFTPNFQPIRIKAVLKNKELVLLIVIIILYGFVCSPVNSYLNLYFTELKASNKTVGFAYAIMAFSELPLFVLGNSLLKKWGASKVMLFAILVMLLRFVLYGFLPVPEIALAVGALQGISLAFFLVGIVAYLHKLLPNQHAMAQTIVWGMFIGIGQTSGNLFIGSLLDSIGMVGVMQLFISIAFLCLAYSFWYFWRYKSL